MIPLNYHHLYYFYVIAREGSIAKARPLLHLAQPTLSTQLKQFEKSVRKKLFERDKNRLILTEHGKLVYNYAQRIFGLTRELEGLLEGTEVKIPTSLHIGVQVGTPKSFCHAALSHALRANPVARVSLVEAPLDRLLKDLEDLRLDIIMTDSPVAESAGPEFNSLLIGRVPLKFVASPEIARKFEKAPTRKEEVPLILPADPSPVYRDVKDWISENGLRSRTVAEVQDVEIARRLALYGFGVAPINAFTFSVSLPANGLVAMKWKFKRQLYESVYLVTRERHIPNPLASSLLRTFRIK